MSIYMSTALWMALAAGTTDSSPASQAAAVRQELRAKDQALLTALAPGRCGIAS